MVYQLRSISYHLNPWRAETGWALWLLCQPSPKLTSAIHQLLVEVSRVSKRREPQICPAELTIQVECSPTTVRRKLPHSTRRNPPIAYNTTPRIRLGSRWYLVSQT